MNKKRTYKEIITIIILTLLSIFLFYIDWINWIISLIFSLIIYSIIIYLIYYSFKKIYIKLKIFLNKNKIYKNIYIFNKKQYLDFLKNFLYRVSTSIFLLFTILWSFWYYQNIYSPAKMPVFTISNWDKIVIFHAMSHIWTEKFYNEVKMNIKKAKENWFVLFYEWVKPWKDENLEKFNKALWVKMDKNLYKNMSKLYWLTNQKNDLFLWLINNNDKNVDISIDEIVELYEKETNKNNITNKYKEEALDANKIIIEQLSSLNEKQLQILRFINKAIINMIIKNWTIQDSITSNFWNKELFNVILWERNKVISNSIINSKDKKIIVTYWLLHFKWVLELLQDNDKNWEIIKTDYLYPIKD